MDSCHVDNPELYYCVYMRESSSCGPRTVYQVASQLCFLSLAALPTWLYVVFSSAQSNRECYLLILGHVQGGC